MCVCQRIGCIKKKAHATVLTGKAIRKTHCYCLQENHDSVLRGKKVALSFKYFKFMFMGVITIESFELEQTSKGLLVQLPSMNRDTLQLHQVLRACPAQPDPEYPQDWASTTSLSGQSL